MLDAGGVVVVPTDTVYGVAAHMGHPDGVDVLFALKGRDRSKALAVLAADVDQAVGLVDVSALEPGHLDVVHGLMSRAWPGPLTVVGPRVQHLRGVDLGGDATTIGVRVPDSPLVRAVAARCGPIVTTSANRSGRPTPHLAAVTVEALEGDVDLVIDGGVCDGEPSTVLDLGAWPPRVLRQGGFVVDEVVTAHG